MGMTQGRMQRGLQALAAAGFGEDLFLYQLGEGWGCRGWWGGLLRWGQAGDILLGLRPCCWFWQRRRDPCLQGAAPLAKSSSRALLPPLLLPLGPSEKGLSRAGSPSAPPQRPPRAATPLYRGSRAPLAHPKGPSSRTRSSWPLPLHPLPTPAWKTP